MPNPFPGMDPFVEAIKMWRTVHHRVVVGISDALNASLPDKYVARIEERCYPIDFEETTYPDVAVHAVSEGQAVYGSRKKVSVPNRLQQPIHVQVISEDMHEIYVQIVCTDEVSKVIAEIEVLSPANKNTGNGRASYLSKQQAILKSSTHFLEIDLLRAGHHTLACPKSLLEEYGLWDYATCLHKGNAGGEFKVWLGTVRHKLPSLRVPLEKSKDGVAFDLQEIFDECYDTCAIAKQVRYNRPAVPPLTSEDEAWANQILKEKGLR